MKILLILIFSLMTTSLMAELPSYCNVKSEKPITKIVPKHAPDYFFKTSPDGRYLYYISEFKNYRIDTLKGTEQLLDGAADPVPSPDGRMLTYLDRDFKLFLTPIDMNQNSNANRTYTDHEKRTYQSVGMVGHNYRLFSQTFMDGSANWTYRDYALENGFIRPLSKTIIVPNSNERRLSMLSKNGQHFTSFNIKTDKTEIVSIISGQTVGELPVGTGKADFSYDDEKIVFHMTVNPTGEERFTELNFGEIQSSQVASRNIFVYDRNKKNLKQVTNFTSGNAFFPVFLRDGRIMYLYKEGNRNEFHVVREPQKSVRSKKAIESCLGVSVTTNLLDSLSMEWMKVCSNWKNKANKAMADLAVLNLPKDYCLLLGSNAQMNSEKMERFCDPEVPIPSSATVKSTPKALSQTQVLLNNKCVICHSEMPVNNPEKLLEWKNKIEYRINSVDPQIRMPRGGSLDTQEKEAIVKYLSELKVPGK